MLRSPRDFAALQEDGQGRADPLVAIRLRRNDLGRSRYAISTGRRVGSAVSRNRTRRRIREVLRAWDPSEGPGWDILVVARPAAATSSFDDLRSAITRLLTQVLSKEGMTTK
jgi:ribonuclease P protein component